MDKIHIILCSLFHFHGIIYGGTERDLTNCQRGPKYEACVCSVVPVNPPFGSIEFVNQTQGTYKCEKGYALKVNAIIRCLKGGTNRSNYWNASESACAAIDDCYPSPCYKENICIDGIEDYTCICLPGYTGKNCSDMTAPQVPQKISEINAVYIAVPVASCLVVLMVLILFLLWRHNKCDLSGTLRTLRKRDPGTLLTNKTYKASGIDRHRSMDDIRQSEVNEYAEISLDNMNTDNSMGDDYQEIRETNDDKTDRNKSYSHIKLSDRDFVDTNDTNYSHIDIGKGPNSIQFDKTYAHTNAVDASNKPEMSWKDNYETYNKLNTVILTKNRVQDGEDTDTEYNHAHSRGQDPKYEDNNYSHLACEATSKSASQGSEESADSNKYEDRNKTTAINITQLCKGTCLDTDYDFAKDNGDLGSSGVSEFAKETHKISDGTTHDYFILAPDPAVDMKSFHVVEDKLGEKEHETHEEMNHDYFVLEKTDALTH